MDPASIYGYILSIQSFQNPEIDSVSLNILEQFAWEKSLSAYQICAKLKSTRLEMAYKNVNKRIHGLVSLNLIHETESDENDVNKHNAKYYSLTEFGIYQLFLNKLNGLHIRELDTKKFNEPPSSNTLIFFHNNHNSLLFESFLYPYFEKKTLFAVGNYLLGDLYNYLADCCHKIKQKLKYYDHRIPFYKTIFCWNKVQTQNEELLFHLKEQFNLESVDSCEIEKKDGNTITVKTTTAPIILRYDREKEKVLAMSRFSGGEYKEVEYGTVKLGSDILVGMHIPDEEILRDIIFDAKKQIQQIIYEFVYDLSLSASNPERAKEFSYCYEILSQDQKFMVTVEDIYKDRHEGFNKGYQILNKNI